MNTETDDTKPNKKRSGENPAADKAAFDEKIEDKIDRDLADSFPASDPPGWTLGVRRRRPKKDKA